MNNEELIIEPNNSIDIAEPSEIPEEIKALQRENEKAEIDKIIKQQKALKKKLGGKQKEKGVGFSVCEARLVEAVEQSKRSMDVFYNKTINEERLSRIKQLLSVYAINRTELLGVKEFFDGLQDSVINLKHRQARDICLTQLKVLETIDLQDKDNINDPSFIMFVSSFVDWITTMHNVLLDQSSYDKRKSYFNRFISKYDLSASSASADDPPIHSSGLPLTADMGFLKSGSKNRFSNPPQPLPPSSITFHNPTPICSDYSSINTEEDNE